MHMYIYMYMYMYLHVNLQVHQIRHAFKNYSIQVLKGLIIIFYNQSSACKCVTLNRSAGEKSLAVGIQCAV